MTANWYVVSFWGGGNVLNQIVVMAAQLCEYTKKHRIVHFKWVNFVVCELDRSWCAVLEGGGSEGAGDPGRAKPSPESEAIGATSALPHPCKFLISSKL